MIKPLILKFLLFLLSLIISVSFYYGVTKSTDSGQELLQNNRFNERLKFWQVGENIPPDLLFKEDNRTVSLSNASQNKEILLSQSLSAPNKKLIKVQAKLATNMDKVNPSNNTAIKVIFGKRNSKGNWSYHQLASISATTRVQNYQHYSWIDNDIREISLSIHLPSNRSELRLNNLSIQSREDKKLLGLSYHRLALLLIAITCALLFWSLIASYAYFSLPVNILSSLSLLLLIYILKSSMGYNLFSNFSLGIWDGFTHFFR